MVTLPSITKLCTRRNAAAPSARIWAGGLAASPRRTSARATGRSGAWLEEAADPQAESNSAQAAMAAAAIEFAAIEFAGAPLMDRGLHRQSAPELDPGRSSACYLRCHGAGWRGEAWVPGPGQYERRTMLVAGLGESGGGCARPGRHRGLRQHIADDDRVYTDSGGCGAPNGRAGRG